VNAVLWTLVVALSGLRLVMSFALPMTGDEAYYWEWSRHLASGYVDHPGSVAWLTAGGSALGRSPGMLRLGFWLCGVIATLAVADCARRFARARGSSGAAAAAWAALLAVVAPMAFIAFGTISPDAPYLAAWALTLDGATVLAVAPSIGRALGTGFACGLALESRAFAVALLAGVLVALRRDLRSFVIVATVASLCAVPLLWWNATHQWSMLIFTLVGRHVNEGFSLLRPLVTVGAVALAFGVGPAILVLCGARLARFSGDFAVPLWTCLPLMLLLSMIVCMERVETYWLLGPYLSLCTVAAVFVAEGALLAAPSARILHFAPAFCLSGLLSLLVLAPEPIARFFAETAHLRLKKAGPFDIYAMPYLARDVKAAVERRHAVAFSDGYGLASLLDYYAGLMPVVIGYAWQGRELRHWYTEAPAHGAALWVDKVPLRERPDFARRLLLACGRVEPGPIFNYTIGALPTARFPTSWCLDMKPRAIPILRWEQSP
jgi:hypothetical protein